MSDHELSETEALLRQRLAQLADHAPFAVRMPDEIQVIPTIRRRRNGRQIGAIAAVTALLGAGGFTTYSFIAAGNDGGAATPEEAVTTFVSSLDRSDVLGMIDVTAPDEVGVLRNTIDSTTSDAKRLDLLGSDFDPSGVKGIGISVDNLKLETNYLEGGLASVTATSGTLNMSFDPKTFQFGSKVRALLNGGQQASSTKSRNLAATGSPAVLMTVQRSGRWYVSLEYTIAEYIRRSAGWEMPAAVTRAPVGFDSPEAAANALYERLAALDLRGALDTFAPGEDAMAWLAQSWLTGAEAAITRGRADGWTVALSGLTYETIGSGSNRTLNPITFKLHGTTPAAFGQVSGGNADPSLPTVVTSADGSGYAVIAAGMPIPATTGAISFNSGFPQLGGSYNMTSANLDGTIVPIAFPPPSNGDPKPFTIERADGCTSYLGEGAKTVFGAASLGKPVDGGFQVCGSSPVGGLGIIFLTTGLSGLPAVSVVESGGKWYVSPLGTVLAAVSTTLHDTASGSSLLDSPLAPFLYGVLSRTQFESTVVGHDAASLDPACLPAVTVVNGKVTAVVADPPPAAVRACATTTFSSSGGVGAPTPSPPVQVSSATSLVPAQEPPASTP